MKYWSHLNILKNFISGVYFLYAFFQLVQYQEQG